MAGLFKKGHELEGCKGPPDLQLGKVPNQLPEETGVVSADAEDIEVLKF